MVFDLTPLDARFAYAALRNRIEYVGMAYNRGTQPPPFFSAAYSEAVGVQTAATPEPAPQAKPKPKPKPTPKGEGKAKAEPKCQGTSKAKPKPAPVPEEEGEGAPSAGR